MPRRWPDTFSISSTVLRPEQTDVTLLASSALLPERLPCPDDEVHVWWLPPGVPGAQLDELGGLLCIEETARASRFVHQAQRDEYIVTRAALRILLARYLGVGPRAIGFDRETHGKPCLNAQTASRGVRFSLAHSGGAALYAVAHGRDVGVDLEQIRPGLASASIASRYYRPDEVALLQALSGAAFVVEFFRCWTRMEARLKTSGRGLAAADGREAACGEGCPVYDLDLAPGFAGAVAVDGAPHRIICRLFPGEWLFAAMSGARPHEC